MSWTPEKLNIFLSKFDIRAKELAKYLGVTNSKISYIRCGFAPIEIYDDRLTAFFESYRQSKIVFHEKMIEYYRNINDE